MKAKDVIRAWKDPDYRASLKEIPESPAGLVELDDVALESIFGGAVSDLESPVVGISVTHSTEGCTVSGWQISCGFVCTATTECFC